MILKRDRLILPLFFVYFVVKMYILNVFESAMIVKVTKKIVLILLLFTKNKNLVGIFLKFLDKQGE